MYGQTLYIWVANIWLRAVAKNFSLEDLKKLLIMHIKKGSRCMLAVNIILNKDLKLPEYLKLFMK